MARGMSLSAERTGAIRGSGPPQASELGPFRPGVAPAARSTGGAGEAEAFEPFRAEKLARLGVPGGLNCLLQVLQTICWHTAMLLRPSISATSRVS